MVRGAGPEIRPGRRISVCNPGKRFRDYRQFPRRPAAPDGSPFYGESTVHEQEEEQVNDDNC
jgi:hypothetical protein